MSIVKYHESDYVTVLDMYDRVNGLNSCDTKLSCFTSDWRSTTVSVDTQPFNKHYRMALAHYLIITTS